MTESKNIIRSLVILAGVLIVTNIAFVSSDGWAKLGWTMLGYTGLFVIYKLARLLPGDIGLARSNIVSGLRYGSAVVLAIFAVLLLAYLVNNQIFKDPRHHENLENAFYASLVLLPLKTVIFEELAFRGLLLSLVYKLKSSKRIAVLVSSLTFGLWHLSSSYTVGDYDIGGGVVVPRLLVMTGIVLITALVGAALCELRWRSKSLIAPIMAHWFINGFGLILAAVSWS
jgi:membrane protease YdiL (CAAX protease family)